MIIKEEWKTRVARMDADERAIMEMIKGRINDVYEHRLDDNLLLDEVEELIRQIEQIAISAEEGQFELPPQERDE